MRSVTTILFVLYVSEYDAAGKDVWPKHVTEVTNTLLIHINYMCVNQTAVSRLGERCSTCLSMTDSSHFSQFLHAHMKMASCDFIIMMMKLLFPA